MSTPILICRVRYFSPKDEEAFFDWLKKIPSIVEFKGVYYTLHLYIKSKRIPKSDLDELIGLFYRYNIDMAQLKIFLNERNKEWFYDNKLAFWHKPVFGKMGT